MPTYEYECLDCGITFEKFQKISDKALKKCISCNGKVKRLISSGAGIIFKGSGFHATDYRSDSYKSDAKKENTPTDNNKAPSAACGSCPQGNTCAAKK